MTNNPEKMERPRPWPNPAPYIGEKSATDLPIRCMHETLIKSHTDDFVDAGPVTLQLAPWKATKFLKALADHLTHKARKDRDFFFTFSGEMEKKKILCLECTSSMIIPVFYGFVSEYSDADEWDKRLMELDKAGSIHLAGLDDSAGCNLKCTECGQMWTYLLGHLKK